jgi:putative ABC transport system permease protein
MSVVLERPVAPPADGGAPARRAIRRWAWRLFRREWRQQVLVLALLIVAIAGTVVGLGVASNTDQLKHDPVFGSANTIIELPGSDPYLSSDIAAIQGRFGVIDVVAHQNIPIPGSVSSIDLRAENPQGPYGNVTVHLDSGHFPNGVAQVAVTKDVSDLLGLHLGDSWSAGGRTLRVVGVVENPLNLLDQFALVSPGQITSPDHVSVLVNTSQGSLQTLQLPSRTGLNVMLRGTADKTAAEALVLVLGTLGLLFVGLMAVAGFTVMAHRRLRSLGMLGALGATDRNIRLLMLANGAAVGITAAVIGTIVGLIGWLAFVPTLESVAGHRIDRSALPWWAIAIAMVLTLITAVGAAWWPARAVSRMSVVAALSGRPPRPQPAHRFAAVGAGFLATGLVLLAFTDQRRAAFIIFGTLATAVGLLLLSPIAIRVLAAGGRHATISIRLALRDLSRYQARSGAALGAVTLAIGIAATIAISAAAAQNPSGPGNLPTNQMVLYFTPGGVGDPIPPLSADQVQTLNTTVNQLAASIHASMVLPLEQAYDPQSALLSPPPGSGGCSGTACAGGARQNGYPTASLARVTERPHGEDVSTTFPLYVATPAVLSHYGIREDQINPASDIISAQSNLRGLQIFAPVFGFQAATKGPANSGRIAQPTIQTFKQLPSYGSDPGMLITPRAMQALGLRPIPSGWLLQTGRPLSTAEISTARQTAGSVGLYLETRHTQKSLAPLRNWATAAGILLALGVLAMTVGLIRSETANDLRTLAATGATSNTRRNLTAATAGGLAFLGGVLGTAGAYAALLVWYRGELGRLSHVPIANLVVIIAGLPLIAAAGGWLLAGREPAVISRKPLE